MAAVFIALPLVALLSYAPTQQESLSGTGLYAELLPTLVANQGGDELDEPPEPADKIAVAASAAFSPTTGTAALSTNEHSRFVNNPPRSGPYDELSEVMQKIVSLLVRLPPCMSHFELMLEEGLDLTAYRQRFVRTYVEALVSYAEQGDSGLAIFASAVRIVDLCITVPWCAGIVRSVMGRGCEGEEDHGRLKTAIYQVSRWINPTEGTQN